MVAKRIIAANILDNVSNFFYIVLLHGTCVL